MRGDNNKNARFTCCVCYIDEQGEERFFEGMEEGTITDELEADILPGLPLSSCFRPKGMAKVYGALSAEDKNNISHRGKAMRQFADYLRKSL